MSDIQWELPIQFIIIQCRNVRNLAIWQVPAMSYREAIKAIKATGQTRSDDTYLEAGRLNTKHLCPINLDLSKFRPRGFIVGTI